MTFDQQASTKDTSSLSSGTYKHTRAELSSDPVSPADLKTSG